MERQELQVLAGVDLTIEQGELISITGASGVGKSTFLHVLGTLDVPTSGTITYDDEEIFGRTPAGISEFRNRNIGFVFQFHHLLPEFSALENVMMPMLIARRPLTEARERARALLDDLGLTHRAEHRPGAMSGGEQQRVAVARALVQSPRALLGDEPSGNLDQETGERLHALLRRLNQEKGITVVVVTHNERLAAACDRVLRLEGGRLHEVAPGEHKVSP
jgi:lipoprotein-releasing system ATP-binding protein